MNQMVVYKNELNTVPLRDFNNKEMDLLFSICSKIKNKGLNEINFTFEELKNLSDYKMTAQEHFIKDLENVYNKLIRLDFRIEDESKIIKFVLFTRYQIDKDKQTVGIKVNDEFKYILNDIMNGFTKFELVEFTNLKSGYSKTAYRLLKQFRKTGYYKIQIDEFRTILDVPECYRMCHINSTVLTPIEKELSLYFENLKINKIKGKGKRKRFVEFIEFIFESELDTYENLKGKTVKCFRDDEGNFYEKDITMLNEEEERKILGSYKKKH